MEKARSFLDDELCSEIEQLNSLEVGSEEHARAVDAVCKMYNAYVNGEKVENDLTDKDRKYELDVIYKEKEFDFQKKTGLFTIALGVVSLIGGYLFDNHWMKEGFKFEESGTYTSKTFNPFTKINPKRK